MNFELIYTSAPRGIKVGTRGYCTVAFTEGMPSNYVQLAESLSGYQKPDGMEIAPVAYSHYRFVVGGQRLSALSRVTTAGYADYTGRRPTIAHHVLLEHASCSPDGNPAGIMADPAMFVTEWHDEPRLIRKPKQIPAPPPAYFDAMQWEQACGDAGWAGALAQSAYDTTPKPVYIIFNPERLDPLPLLAESLNLLPPDMRWTVTFNTFFSSLPHGTTCRWRCCLPDSPALREMRATPGALCIDLTKPLGCAPDGPLVESARTGAAPSWPQRRVAAFMQPPTATPEEKKINIPVQQEQAGFTPKTSMPMPPLGHVSILPEKKQKMWPIAVASASIASMIVGALALWLIPKFYRTSLPPVVTRHTVPPEAMPDQQAIPLSPHPTHGPLAPPAPESVQPVPAPEPVQSPPGELLDEVTPELQSKIISPNELNQKNFLVQIKDPDCSTHQHVFYFKSGGRQAPEGKSKQPSVLSGKSAAFIEYQITATRLKVQVFTDKIVFSSETMNSTAYPVSMRIERDKSRDKSGEKDLVIWLQTLNFERPFIETHSGYQISISHDALNDCLFGLFLPTTNRPWAETCRIRFKHAANDLKDIPFSIKQAGGGQGGDWIISFDKINIEAIKTSMREQIAQIRETWKNNYSTNYVREVVANYQRSISKKPDFPGRNNIANCLKNLARQIMEEKKKELETAIKQSGFDGRTIQDLENEIRKEFRDKTHDVQQDFGKMIETLETKTIKDAEAKKAKADTDRKKNAKSNIQTADAELNALTALKNRIKDLMGRIERQESYDLMNKRLNAGYSEFFDLIFAEEDQDKFQAFGQDEFQKIADLKAFTDLIKQPLPGEPDPENMLMTVDIYSCDNPGAVLLSLIQQDDKGKNTPIGVE